MKNNFTLNEQTQGWYEEECTDVICVECGEHTTLCYELFTNVNGDSYPGECIGTSCCNASHR